MGANGSKPVDRSQRVKVIGAGYPRTGTTTLVLACEKLLNGQGLHGGSHGLAREDEYNRKCYELYKYRHDKPRVLQLLKELTEGERESYNPTSGQIPNPESMERHMQSVIDSVPKDRLHIVRLEDGWAPLCKILDCPIPNEPFPKANDAENAEQIFLNMVKRSLAIWLYYILAGTCLAGSGWWLWKNFGHRV
ncbi:hypothetical protein TsFJ059_004758 [Trichoderma semiorbis]|uniref:NAD dependent epimerase/dehydratase n=1 Tax=Trichoderma semiorbis TaxID=1491008 RepID=A0A9P8HSB3_9HYPO|nr:hypothetical protein TsFJ059_004758 [Trichoderma semiorbis]